MDSNFDYDVIMERCRSRQPIAVSGWKRMHIIGAINDLKNWNVKQEVSVLGVYSNNLENWI
ncbi:MAG: hypothetical protein LBH67_03530 [Rickettsia sp.]|nr:hypothetical protein [Rickettsia sp.]